MIVATRSTTAPRVSSSDQIAAIFLNDSLKAPEVLCLRFRDAIPPDVRISMGLVGWRYDAARNEWRVAYHPAQQEQRLQEILQLRTQWGCQFFPHYAETNLAVINQCEVHV